MSCAETAEPFDLPFGLWTSLGQRKYKFNRIRQVAPLCSHGRAHCCHLANTIEPSAAAAMRSFFKLLWPLVIIRRHDVRRCSLLLLTQVAWSVYLSVTLVSCAKMAAPIEMLFGLRTAVGPRNHVLDVVQIPPWEGAFLRGEGASIVKYRDTLQSSVQKRLNQSRCRSGGGLGWTVGIVC